jgi:hypothetical protein
MRAAGLEQVYLVAARGTQSLFELHNTIFATSLLVAVMQEQNAQF